MDEIQQKDTETGFLHWARTRRWPWMVTLFGLSAINIVGSQIVFLRTGFWGVPLAVQAFCAIENVAVVLGIAELVQRWSDRARRNKG